MYTDEDISFLRQGISVPPNFVPVRTQIGGVVFVDQARQDVIDAYQTGVFTGAIDEAIPQGVFVRILAPPDATTPPQVLSPLPVVYDIPSTTETPIQTVPLIQKPPQEAITPAPVSTSERFYEARTQITINLNVIPQIPQFAEVIDIRPASLRVSPLPLRLRDSFESVMKDLLSGKVDSFYDEERVMKTLLNFGNDYQALITNWIYDPTDSTNQTILVKLYRPLPDDIEEKDQLWIARELAPTVIDRVFADFTAAEPPKVFLRPPNRDITVTGQNGSKVDNRNLRNLLSSGTFDPVRPTDPVLEEWFSFDVNQTELNINYADYREFIFFGGAEARLNAFINKLLTIENLDRVITINSSSLALTGSVSVTSSLPYQSIRRLANERLDLIRSFDSYERFLYYESGVPYSSSLTTDDHDDEIFFNVDCTWPKISGSVMPVASASVWIAEQQLIARSYDSANQNSLVNTLPQYLQNDAESQDFRTFLNLVGHQFDNIKIYIDKMDVIYDRGNDPSKDISVDLIWSLASNFGIDLPNQYSVKSLVDYTIGETASVTPKIYHRVAAETWKRFLHNQIFMMKTKGTKASLRALINAYGILPSTIQIRESATPGTDNTEPVFELIEEQTNALEFTLPSYVQIPWATSSLDNRTIQLRFATTAQSNGVLLNGNNFAICLEPVTNTFGRVVVKDATATTIVSSSILDVFSGNFYSVMLRNNGSDMTFAVKRAEGADIIDSFVASIATSSFTFNTSQYINLGGSGSFFGTPFVGLVDEFRVWGEVTTDEIFDQQVQYPGLYNGNTATSVRDTLWVRLSFNKPQNIGVNTQLQNESPWARRAGIPAIMRQFTGVGFPNQPQFPNSMEVITREVLRFAPNAGSQFTSNKVVIVPPARPKTIGDTSIPVLSPFKSMVPVQAKRDKTQSTNLIGFYFSLTDAINDSIIRTLGTINLQDLLGDPADVFNSTYTNLTQLSDLYWESYAYNYNINSFVDFVRNLLDPLFKQARQFVPARAQLLSGIVHEPHILERNKVKNRPVQVTAGSLTRNDSDTQNLFAPPIRRDQFIIITGEDKTFQGVVRFEEIYDSDAELPQFEGRIREDEITEIIGDFATYEVATPAIDEDLIDASYPVYDDKTNQINFTTELLTRFGVTSTSELTPEQLTEFSRALLSYKNPAIINLNALYETSQTLIAEFDFPPIIVNPLNDFDDLASRTYFTQPDGLWKATGIEYQRVNQNILRDRGAWTAGTTYSRNDFVTRSGSLDSEPIEYLSITTDTQFTSFIPPESDTVNWKRMTYIPVEVDVLKKAILINGLVSIAPLDSPYPSPQGYLPQHYKFTRDYRRGALNPRWLGCLQTDQTTPDGRPAVEVTFTAGDRLVVNNPGEPIQPIDNQAGPILDIE